MQVVYFLFALEKFQRLFELISVSFCLCITFVYAIFCIAFAEWKWCEHLRDNWNSAFQYFKLHQISSRRSPPSKSNKWAITISVYFVNIWHKYSWAKKTETSVTKLCSPISPDVISSFKYGRIVHCSKDKITCKTDLHFCELWWKQENLCVLFPSPPLLS